MEEAWSRSAVFAQRMTDVSAGNFQAWFLTFGNSESFKLFIYMLNLKKSVKMFVKKLFLKHILWYFTFFDYLNKLGILWSQRFFETEDILSVRKW